MQSLELTIEGMSCGHCVRSVHQALEHVDGVTIERVGIGEAALAYDSKRTGPGRILAAISDQGFRPHVRPPEPRP